MTEIASPTACHDFGASLLASRQSTRPPTPWSRVCRTASTRPVLSRWPPSLTYTQRPSAEDEPDRLLEHLPGAGAAGHPEHRERAEPVAAQPDRRSRLRGVRRVQDPGPEPDVEQGEQEPERRRARGLPAHQRADRRAADRDRGHDRHPSRSGEVLVPTRRRLDDVVAPAEDLDARRARTPSGSRRASSGSRSTPGC